MPDWTVTSPCSKFLFSSPVPSTRRAIVVTPVVHVRIYVGISFTLHWSFICKIFNSWYLGNHSSESIHVWNMGTLEGSHSFHDSWLHDSQGPCSGVGLEVKIKNTLKSNFCFPVTELMEIVDWTSVYLMTWLVCYEVKVSMTYIPWSSDFAWYLGDYDGCSSNFWIMSQCDSTFDFKINVGHSDLYFTVQWFCLISGRLFDGWTSCFCIMSQHDPIFDLKIKI